MKIERLERQRAKLPRQSLLLVGGQDVSVIAEPFRQARGREQIGLSRGRGGAELDGGRLRSSGHR